MIRELTSLFECETIKLREQEGKHSIYATADGYLDGYWGSKGVQSVKSMAEQGAGLGLVSI